MIESLPHVSIAMCTFNAGNTLSAQLNSFVDQDHENWSLWVSDDGSTDDTLAILEDFRQRVTGRHDVHILQGPAARTDGPVVDRNHAAARNFLSLLTRPELPRGMVAVSDQDDVWLRGKLSRALRWVARSEAETGPVPTVYGAQSFHVDSALSLTGKSRHASASADFRNALVENIVSGHSTVLNVHALDVLRRAGPDVDVPFHDWWIYQLVSGAGGRVLVDPRRVLLYRQHGANVIGAPTGVAAAKARLSRIAGMEYRGWIRSNGAALLRNRDLLTDDARWVVDTLFAPGAERGLARMRRFRKLGLHRQSAFGTALLLVLSALGRA